MAMRDSSATNPPAAFALEASEEGRNGPSSIRVPRMGQDQPRDDFSAYIAPSPEAAAPLYGYGSPPMRQGPERSGGRPGGNTPYSESPYPGSAPPSRTQVRIRTDSGVALHASDFDAARGMEPGSIPGFRPLRSGMDPAAEVPTGSDFSPYAADATAAAGYGSDQMRNTPGFPPAQGPPPPGFDARPNDSDQATSRQRLAAIYALRDRNRMRQR